jgi:hypothetical protein
VAVEGISEAHAIYAYHSEAIWNIYLDIEEWKSYYRGAMSNQVKSSTCLVLFVLYGVSLTTLALNSYALLAVLFSFYVIVVGYTTMLWLKEDERAIDADIFSFYRDSPLARMGVTVAEYVHTFTAPTDVHQQCVERISRACTTKRALSPLKDRQLKDIDPSFDPPPRKLFYQAVSSANACGTRIVVLVHSSRNVDLQIIQWWIMVRGRSSADKRMQLLGIAPLAFPFFLLGRLQHRLDLTQFVREIPNNFFNLTEVVTDAIGVHGIVLDAVVETLEEHHIDTSDLKQHRGQTLNVSVSGGKVKIGKIAQFFSKNQSSDARVTT